MDTKKEDSFSDFFSESFLEEIGHMAMELDNFPSAEDIESELEACCTVPFNTTDPKTTKLIEEETDVILIENDNATEEENKQQKDENEEVHEIERVTIIEVVPQGRDNPFIIYECINLQ